MPTLRALLSAVLLAALALPACARDACAPRVVEGWVRMPPVAMPMLAGFGRIENACDAPVVIVGASSPAFADVSLHETRVVDGVSRMRPLPELRIAPDGAAVLAPGGMHLMLMQPTAPLEAGDTVEIEFELEDGRRLRGTFAVRGI